MWAMEHSGVVTKSFSDENEIRVHSYLRVKLCEINLVVFFL